MDIDLAAVRHNVRHIAEIASPARVMAVVKADGYGHGAVPVAQAALGAGPTTSITAAVPALAALGAWPLLGEPLGAFGLLGVALVCVGMLLGVSGLPRIASAAVPVRGGGASR